MTGMLITIEKKGVSIELRRIKDESAAAHVLSPWQVPIGVELDLEPLTIMSMIFRCERAINDTKDFIDNLSQGAGRLVRYHAALAKENRKELAEYEDLQAFLWLLHEILLNDLEVRVRLKKIVW